jgi:hypothetical protein
VRWKRHEAPRLAGLVLALTLLVPLPALARNSDQSAAYSAATGLGATLCTLVYTPLKIVYAGGGSLISGLAWMWTLGDKDVAGPIFKSSVRGDYVVTPRNLEGRDKLVFVGPQY